METIYITTLNYLKPSKLPHNPWGGFECGFVDMGVRQQIVEKVYTTPNISRVDYVTLSTIKFNIVIVKASSNVQLSPQMVCRAILTSHLVTLTWVHMPARMPICCLSLSVLFLGCPTVWRAVHNLLFPCLLLHLRTLLDGIEFTQRICALII